LAHSHFGSQEKLTREAPHLLDLQKDWHTEGHDLGMLESSKGNVSFGFINYNSGKKKKKYFCGYFTSSWKRLIFLLSSY